MTVLTRLPVWSKSQVAAFRECARKGAFSSSDDPMLAQGRAQEFKKLKNRFLWAGAAVHQAIGDVVKALRQGDPLPDADALISALRERMRAQYRASQLSTVVSERLFEHEYGVTLPKETWQAQWETIESSLRWFLSSPWAARLAALGPETWKAVDDILSFDVDGAKAYVKIDCALDVDGKFILIDWKTSALKPGDADGLRVAALYAHEVWGAEAEQISAYAVSLTEKRSQLIAIDEEALMDTFMKIQEETAFLIEQKAVAGADPFSLPLADNEQTCLRCNFQKLCHPSGL